MRIDMDRLFVYVLAASFALASAAASAAGRPLLSTGQDPDALAINIGEGETREWTDNIEVGHTNIYVNVASNGALTISGNIAAGSLVKRGLGRVAIAGRVNRIEDGIFCEEGIMSVQDASALEETGSIHISDGTFEFAGDGSGVAQTLPCPLVCSASKTSKGVDGIIDLKIETPLVVTNIDVLSGCILKRGTGVLSFDVPVGETMTLSCCDGTSVKERNGYPATPYYIGNVSDPAMSRPVTGYVGFNVAEGEVRLTGGEDSIVDIPHCVNIGMSAGGVRSAPAVSVDGVDARISSKNQLLLSSCVSGGNALCGMARLCITNGANMSTKGCRSGVDSVSKSFPTVVVERATWNISNFILPYGIDDTVNTTYILRDGAAVYVNGGNVNYRMESWGGNRHKIHIDGSVLAGDSVFGGMQMRATGYSVSVVNGGVLSTWRMREKDAKFVLDLSFDGGTWIADAGKWQPMKFMHATNVVIRTKGADGLTFPVEAGYTVEATQAVTGEGGMTKTGGGTYVFCRRATWYAEDADNENQGKWQKDLLDDPVTLAFEGTLDVQGGDVLVESGACRIGGAYNAAEGASVDFGGNDLGEGVTFSGGGKLSNFTATAPTISVPLSESLVATNGAPWFLSAAISGPVLVDFGSPVANARGRQVAVAKFADSIPSVSSWLMTGVPKGYMASLGVSGSSVVADIHRTGFTIRLK